MCVAISGRCFMSQYIFNKSANRGECIQPCRREYEIYEKGDGYSLLLGEDYVMSPKDLCTINFIDKLIETGIHSFKIEGRKRSPEYILTVVSIYRKAIDLYFEGKLTEEKKSEFYLELNKVYNRGFTEGFYFSEPGETDYARQYGSIAATRKKYIGKVLNYYKIPQIAHVKLEAGDLKPGEKIYIIGNSTGVVEMGIDKLMVDDLDSNGAVKGDEITFKCDETVRINDKVYKIVNS